MTVTQKQKVNNDYCISLEIKTAYGKDFYVVQVCPKVTNDLYGYPIATAIYSMEEKSKANRTFSRYVKKYMSSEKGA